MHRLAYVDLNHFRSFRKPSRINFPEKGLMRIRGRNLDTGGESGAGKSTVPLAINFALGRCPYPATELASWGTNSPASTSLGFRDETCIERGKKFGIAPAGREEVKGSAAQKEDWLSKFFGGLDMDMVMALTYRGQKKPGLFLSKTDSEKKEFLTRLLGLDKFEKAIDDSKVRAAALEAQILGYTNSYDAVMRSISELGTITDVALLKQDELTCKNSIDFKVDRIVSVKVARDQSVTDASNAAQAERDSFIPQIQEAQARIKDLQSVPTEAVVEDVTELTHQKAIAAQCQERIGRLTSEDLIKRHEFEQQRDALVARISGLERSATSKVHLSREKARLVLEYETLVNDICPTCNREWDKAIERRARIEMEVFAINAKLEECEEHAAGALELRTQLGALPRFEANAMIARLQAAQSEARSRAAAEQQKLDNASAALNAERRRMLAEARADEAVLKSNAESAAIAAATEHLTKIKSLDKDLAEEQERLQQTRAKLSDVQQEIVRYTTLHTQRDRLQQQADEAKKLRDEKETLLRVEKDFLFLIGREGFLGSIFDEVLAEIGDETNQLLASVSNTRQCTLRFASETTTQKGTVKKEIKPVVTIHGHEAPMASGLSGGMYTVVELAVDLALGAVISRRSGVCPGWLILDESFDGLGAVEKESAMEILQRYAQDRLVIVIDHTSEFQGMFSQCVTIEYKDGDSWVAE